MTKIERLQKLIEYAKSLGFKPQILYWDVDDPENVQLNPFDDDLDPNKPRNYRLGIDLGATVTAVATYPLDADGSVNYDADYREVERIFDTEEEARAIVGMNGSEADDD